MVHQVISLGVSARRSCGYLGLCRRTLNYVPRPEDPTNALIREELRRLSVRFRRYGTPRMTALLRREGHRVNHKRVERLWREESLPLPRRRRRRRRPSVYDRPQPATGPNQVWSYDFLHDRTEHGQRLKILTVVDEYTRECLEIRVEKKMDSRHVVETLDELMADRGVPRFTRSDNGAEFVSHRLTNWLRGRGAKPMFIRPGSPWENGFVESFHGKLRDECLSEELFYSRGECQVIVDWWRDVYNRQRPHSSLGFRTPAEVAEEYLTSQQN
jgi:putative transposase